MKISAQQIREVFVRNGFKLSNETGDDLKQYVYNAARELIALAQEVEPLVFVRCDESPEDLYFNTCLGKYIIFKFDSGYLAGIDDFVICSNIGTEEQAKEAAQQDYAKRVRSGLKYGGGE